MTDKDHSDSREQGLPGVAEPFREQTRAPLETTVRLKFDSFGSLQTGRTANVSRGGMFVGGTEPRPVGTLVKFEIQLSVSSPPLTGLGEVVWIRLKQRDLERPPGMGVQFRYLDADSLLRLDVAVHKALVALRVPEEPAVSSVKKTRRDSRLLDELEAALASCEEIGPASGRRS